MHGARLVFGAGLTVGVSCALAWGSDQDRRLVSTECTQLNHLVVSQVAKGETKQAEAALSEALVSSSSQPEAVCSGLIFSNLAAIMLNSGRLADAEAFAQRALTALATNHSLNDPMLLRPLQIVGAARFQQGKIGAARQV